MKSKNLKILLLAALVLLVVGIAALQVRRLTRPRDFSLRAATLTSIDPGTRSGTVEFVHPKSGRMMKFSAERIPQDCEITINGAPADVTALRVDDQATIEGTYYPRQGSAVPRAIHVHRAPTAPATAPSSTDAGATRVDPPPRGTDSPAAK